MKDWLTALETEAQEGRVVALVTIADAKGSSPREAGVKMLVTEAATAGTVGGGNLEHEAIRIARGMLKEGRSASQLRRFALGPSLGQCCGGNTQLLFEVIARPTAPAELSSGLIEPLRTFAHAKTPCVLASPIKNGPVRKTLVSADEISGVSPPHGLVEAARDLLSKPINAGTRLWTDSDGDTYLLEQTPGRTGHVLLIGAGHVGKAMAHVFGTLPFAVTWADNRPDQYPDEIPANITIRCTPHLERTIDEAPAGTIFLVMTYSHDLDYALCARVLKRGDFRYLGLIGSKTKRARFEKTMTDLGIERTMIERVVCPIGLPGISSKQPQVIAVATAAQILSLAPSTPAN